MATNAAHPIAQEVRQARSSRFVERISACKVTFDREGQPRTFHQQLLASITGGVAELHQREREADNQPNGEESQSFLQLYMKAFAAARQ